MVLLHNQQRLILNEAYQWEIKSALHFELKSFIGRTFFNQQPSLKGTRNLLNLGCGSTLFEGWVNADFFVLNFLRSDVSRPEWMLDLRFPLNCPDTVWDGVFSEHTLEHLYPNQALNLLKETYRTMKPGAWLRITVPDLKKYVNYYLSRTGHEKFKGWSTGCEAIRTLTQDYLHLSVWDAELLGIFLKEVGFEEIREVPFMEGTDSTLLKDKAERRWESLYMEARKPHAHKS
jgi:predicted SAM-dependent methyltransferase